MTVLPNLPAAESSFTNKYAPGSPLTTTLPAVVPEYLRSLPALQRHDQQRVTRGQSPLTLRQSIAALKTIETGKPATPPRRQGLLKSALSDLRDLVTSVPKIPLALYREAQALPDSISNASSTLADASNPVQGLGNLASTPGFRFVPGAFLAQQLAADAEHGGEGVQGLLAHPLFTALDVLPLASGAAKLSPAYRTQLAALNPANEARVAARVAEGFDASTTRVLAKPHPLTAAITQRVPRGAEVAGELGTVPNNIGNLLANARDLFSSTTPGRAVDAAFSSTSRDLARTGEAYTTFLREWADPRVPNSALRYPGAGGTDAIADLLPLRTMSQDIQRQLTDLHPDFDSQARFYRDIQNPRSADGSPTSIEHSTLTPEEKVVARQIKDHQAIHADLLVDQSTREGQGLGRVSIDGRNEVYELRTARRLSNMQTRLSKAQEMRAARDMILDPSKLTDPAVIDRAMAEVEIRRAGGQLTRKEAETLTRTYERALDEAGYYLDDQGSWQRDNPRPSIPDVISSLKPFRSRPVVTRLIDHLQNARWADANADLATLKASRVHLLPLDFDGFRAELSRLIARDRDLARTAQYTDRYLTQLDKKLQGAIDRNTPARFYPAVQQQATDTITARARDLFSTEPDLPALISQIEHGIYDIAVDRAASMGEDFNKLVRDDQRAAMESWRALRDAGLDPVYVQRVTPQQARAQEFVRISDAPTSITATKRRLMDATPTADNVGIALNQEGLDLIRKRGVDAFLDEIASRGTTRAQLTQDLLPLAERRYAANPSIPLASHLDSLISSRWVKWDPGSFTYSGGSQVFSPGTTGDIYVPRTISENIQRMFTPPLPKLTAASDPIMRAFRTSVLPLALRWQVNNLVSGALVLGVNDPAAFLQLPRAIRQVRGDRKLLRGEIEAAEGAAEGAARTRSNLAGAPPSTIGSQPSEIRAWDVRVTKDSPFTDRLHAARNYALGRTFARWADQARQHRLLSSETSPSYFRSTVEKSYDLNQFVDEVVRMSIGESQLKRLGRQGGKSRELMEAETATRIRKTFQAWDEMTPIERSVIRAVIPFYGFASYATRFALRYPFDHPFRASILNSIARAELEDSMTGLPEYLRDMIFLGDKDAKGHQRALNINPFNPYSGVPSMFTLSGLLGQLAPQYTAALESIGIDVQQGGPQLYPEMRYDPESGRLVADPSGNYLSNLFGNVSPQLQGVMAILGRNEDFNSLLARDPQAAGRQLLSDFGIPVLFRDVAVDDALVKAEMARLEDMETAKREALKSGDIGGLLNAYPHLGAYGQQITQLHQSGMLDAYKPDEEQGVGRMYAAQMALTGVAGK